MKSPFLPLLIFLASIPAWSAPRVNNGGGAWSCRLRGEEDYHWLRAADLFEPLEEGASIAPARAGAKAEEILAEKRELIRTELPELDALLRAHPVDLASAIRYVDFPLSATGDMNFESRPAPEDCPGGEIAYVQLADYLYDDTLLIQEGLWKSRALQELDRAAILLHEQIYKALRDERDEKTSRRTRKLVATVFSNMDPAQRKFRVGILLLHTQEGENEEVATFPVAVKCDAFVGERLAGSWQPLAGKFGQAHAFTVEGYRFELATSERDGVPELLRITRPRAGSAEISGRTARHAYLGAKQAEVILRTGREEAARLYCWNQL